ncbi:stalk domain-containing protein [Cohnella thermotolerans]|uniref:stalk domain-containing protein n=1 Tax=Cohnella thermotolerans TaxID=329858 RepID=UPI000423D0B9|nr:stalk domain-containing protein [Cohnella thermotolerans]
MLGKFRLLGAAVLAGTLVWSAAGPQARAENAPAAAAAATAGQPYRIVVLGDSVSVGYEPGIVSAADIYGYGERLLDQALLHGRAEESNYAVLGLTTEGLTRLLQGAKDKKPLTASQLQAFDPGADPRALEQANGIAARTAELNAALAQADLVAMTIGGNDFLDYIRELALLDTKDALTSLDEEIDSKLNNYAEQLSAALKLLHELAPGASIKLTDQYLPLPERFNAELYARLKQVTDDLADRLDGIAQDLTSEGVDIQIVHVRDLFVGKELSLTHIFTDTDVHPNQAGYSAIAERFAESIWNSYTAIPAAGKGTPASPAAPAIYIDGRLLATANKPKLKNGTTFLALSDVAAATGAELGWDNKTRTAVFRKDGREVSITVGSKTMKANGTARSLTAPAYLETVGKTQKTYVPLAAVANGLQYQVVYRSKLNTAFIHS